MISGANRKKLIDGIAIVAGMPKGASKYDAAEEEAEGEEPEVPMDDEGSAEGLGYARDALAAINEYRGMYGMGESEDPSVKAIHNKQRDIVAAAFREAIWGLMRSNKQ